MNEFLVSDQTIDQGGYFRIIILGCLDAIFVFPSGIYNLIINVLEVHPLLFWPGRSEIHSDWDAFGEPWNANTPTELQLR